jgi:hypothetical protein
VIQGERCLKSGIPEENLVEVIWKEDTFLPKKGQWLDKKTSATDLGRGFDDRNT